MRNFSLQLRLRGRGWMEATITATTSEVTLPASYLSDGVGDLASGARSLLEGAAEARWTWAEEPGEYRWSVRREGETLRMVVLRFEETFSRKLDGAGEPIFEAECAVHRFATQVRGQLQSLLNEWGEDGYRREWGHPFPRAEHQRLTELLAERKQSSTSESE